MKTILVPTDFSEIAIIAAHYAAALAHFTKARILLFHTYHISLAVADPAIDLDLENFENFNQTKIDNLAYELHKTYGISVTRIMRPGFAADEIPAIAKRFNTDLVVMGMRGSSKLSDTLLGTVTQSLLHNSNTPLLCVPVGAVFEPFTDIIFTFDSMPLGPDPDREVMDRLHNLFRAGALTDSTSISGSAGQLSLVAASSTQANPVLTVQPEAVLAGDLEADNSSHTIQLPVIKMENYYDTVSSDINLTANLNLLARRPFLAVPAKW